MKIIGLDLSINSTGVCVYNDGKSQLKGGDKAPTNKYYIIAADKSLKVSQRNFIEFLSTLNPIESKNAQYKEARICLQYMIYQKEASGVSAMYQQKEMEKSDNIYQIVHRIELIIKKEKPDYVVIEGIAYGSANSKALADLAGLNHAVRYMLNLRGIPFVMITPKSNKKQATGNGAAKKDEMLYAWLACDNRLDSIKDDLKLDDLADAYFLAHAEINFV